jgi:hypothetical protein
MGEAVGKIAVALLSNHRLVGLRPIARAEHECSSFRGPFEEGPCLKSF